MAKAQVPEAQQLGNGHFVGAGKAGEALAALLGAESLTSVSFQFADALLLALREGMLSVDEGAGQGEVAA